MVRSAMVGVSLWATLACDPKAQADRHPIPDEAEATGSGRIAELRRERGMTQADLAEKLEVSTRFVQRVEAGEKNLSLKFLAELAPILRATVQEMTQPPDAARSKPGRPKAS